MVLPAAISATYTAYRQTISCIMKLQKILKVHAFPSYLPKFIGDFSADVSYITYKRRLLRETSPGRIKVEIFGNKILIRQSSQVQFCELCADHAAKATNTSPDRSANVCLSSF